MLLRSVAVAVPKSNSHWRFALWLGLCLALVLPFSIAAATTRIWTGAAFPDTNWANGLNWAGDAAPSAGDDLVFPAGAQGLASFNDLPAGTEINSIMLVASGYSLAGFGPFLLNTGITSTSDTGANTIQVGLVLNGPGTVATAAGGTLILNGVLNLNGHDVTFASAGSIFAFNSITNSGGITKTGPGTLQLNRPNAYDGPTRVLEGRVIVSDDLALGLTTGDTLIAAGAELQVLNGRVMAEPLQLAGTVFSGFSTTNVWTGPVTLIEPGGVIQVNGGGALRVDGVVSGTGGLTKTQAGDLVLAADNIYTGPTAVQGGFLYVNGSQPGSAVQIAAGGALRGTGTCGAVTNGMFSHLIPGLSNAPGVLRIDGELAFAAFSELAVRLNGPTAGLDYDQVDVTGGVSFLGSARLQLFVGAVPPMGSSFVIVRSGGADPVMGTFGGLSEGSLVLTSNAVFSISYSGGDGNDITLTRESLPSSISSILCLTNGLKQIVGLGLPNLPYAIEAAPDLDSPILWQTLGTNFSNGSGAYQFIDQDSLVHPMRFYRVRSP